MDELLILLMNLGPRQLRDIVIAILDVKPWLSTLGIVYPL